MTPAGASTNLTSRINGMTTHTHTHATGDGKIMSAKAFSTWFFTVFIYQEVKIAEYECLFITRLWINREGLPRVANPARDQLNRENNVIRVRINRVRLPKNKNKSYPRSRLRIWSCETGFGRPVPRQLPYSSHSG